ncbi:hypothetical protein [Ensifer sp. SL37]|uniref:hypothetical protein n=1 Tax=Ensifer sp. SL37 TaxID=2995137 RepID=UPI0022758F61|nr:hypothetical protein [Ensifer sp. SL37]MCY1745069.1 hypothetical protein [Ensifer sp. SL37]
MKMMVRKRSSEGDIQPALEQPRLRTFSREKDKDRTAQAIQNMRASENADGSI